MKQRGTRCGKMGQDNGGERNANAKNKPTERRTPSEFSGRSLLTEDYRAMLALGMIDGMVMRPSEINQFADRLLANQRLPEEARKLLIELKLEIPLAEYFPHDNQINRLMARIGPLVANLI